eukprot:CAMPEP_0202949060 /NCGR_PEP_ID=MMETSP1395-20130829/14907_1 /ASSEMBLY_ACC=CAM_ASM_000871 /TAXON_ID=5961 /ORGANISM="Blepharisma japonicum, Strain Stock R1072" /LENGTH=372 /DNA_ID=CAMNT_0049651739 /DNA_START=38 /DNA_END=1153 /DNA_ORIENTATION=+
MATYETKEKEPAQLQRPIRKQHVRLSVVPSKTPLANIDSDLLTSVKEAITKSEKSHGIPEDGQNESKNSRILVAGAPHEGRQNGFEDKRIRFEGENSNMSYVSSIGVGIACKKGLKEDPHNQDDFTVLVDKAFQFFGVFDGHGAYGHEISNFIHLLLPKLIIKHEQFEENIHEAIIQSFLRANSSLVEHCDKPESTYDCMMSGTTATTVLIRNGHIFIGHVGDSRAVLCLKNGENIEAKRLTTDHKPTLAGELQRIQACNGEVKQLPDDVPHRIFMKGKDYPGLSTSRALGDAIAQMVGVSPLPQYEDVPMQDNFEYIIMCSDGVWEFVKDQEAADIISKSGKNVRQGAQNLASFAWQQWITNEEDVVDDIT